MNKSKQARNTHSIRQRSTFSLYYICVLFVIELFSEVISLETSTCLSVIQPSTYSVPYCPNINSSYVNETKCNIVSKHSSNTGLIAGVVVGFLLLVAIGVIVGIVVYKRRKSRFCPTEIENLSSSSDSEIDMPPEGILTEIKFDDGEFEIIKNIVNGKLNNHIESYVGNRIKSGLKPISFDLKSATKVENIFLKNQFEKKKDQMKLSGRSAKEMKERFSFHGTNPGNIKSICNNGLLKIGHPKNPSKSTDSGYFGDPKQGICVGKYPDYSLKYSNKLQPLKEGQSAKVIVFKTLPGKSCHIEKITVATPPTPGYDSHSSPNYMEWYLFDEAQCYPVYIIELEAFINNRILSDDE